MFFAGPSYRSGDGDFFGFFPSSSFSSNEYSLFPKGVCGAGIWRSLSVVGVVPAGHPIGNAGGGKNGI